MRRQAPRSTLFPYTTLFRSLVELQTRNASAVGKQRGLGESTKFLAVHKGFQDILLHFQIAVDDAVKPHSQFGKILHRLADAVIGRDIVGCRFGAEEEAIADVL